MADAQQVIAEARQALTRVLRKMLDYMEQRSAAEQAAFGQLMDSHLPGVRQELLQGHGLSDAQLATQLATRQPGWEGRTAQFFSSPIRTHPMFDDPTVDAAVTAYAGHTQRLQAIATERNTAQPQREVPGPQRQAPAQVLRRSGELGYNPPQAAQVFRDLDRTRQAQTPPAPTARPAQAPTARPAQAPTARPSQAPSARSTPAPGSRIPGQPAQPTPPARPAEPPTRQLAQPTPPQAGPQTGAQAGVSVEATARTLTAGMTGPVVLDAELLGSGGRVVVRADPDCTQARITISTADQTGPAADAVRGADLSSTPDGRVTASVQTPGNVVTVSGPPGAGNIVGDAYVVQNGNVTSSYYTNGPNGADVRSTATQYGNGGITHVANGATININDGGVSIQGGVSGGSFNFQGSSVSVNGNTFTVDGNTFTVGQATSPIEIHAVVPEGSSVECSTDSANLEVHGKVNVVEANSAAGSVSVEQATEVTADTASGRIEVGTAEHVKADSASGSVSVGSATDVRANTASGSVSVGSAEKVRADSASGSVSVDQAKDVKATTASGNIDLKNADKAVAKSASGDVKIGRTKDANARSRHGDVSITDVRGTARADSVSGAVNVHANEGGKVTAGSVTGSVKVTASDKAIADGLTVKAEGPPGRVSVPEGANTGAATSAGSSGARDFNSAGRSGPSHQPGTWIG